MKNYKRTKKNWTSKPIPVAQYDMEGNLITMYPSMAAAGRVVGATSYMISRATEGSRGRKSCKGFV